MAQVPNLELCRRVYKNADMCGPVIATFRKMKRNKIGPGMSLIMMFGKCICIDVRARHLHPCLRRLPCTTRTRTVQTERMTYRVRANMPKRAAQWLGMHICTFIKYINIIGIHNPSLFWRHFSTCAKCRNVQPSEHVSTCPHTAAEKRERAAYIIPYVMTLSFIPDAIWFFSLSVSLSVSISSWYGEL